VMGIISANNPMTATELAAQLHSPGSAEIIFKICNHLSANGRLQKEGEGISARFSRA
jgi:hypothetical protein